MRSIVARLKIYSGITETVIEKNCRSGSSTIKKNNQLMKSGELVKVNFYAHVEKIETSKYFTNFKICVVLS